MKAAERTSLALLFLLAAVIGSDARAQSAPQPELRENTSTGLDLTGLSDEKLAASPHHWHSEFTALLWFQGLSGDIGVRGQETDVSANFIDVVEASDSVFALSGRLELGYGPVVAFVDAFYANLGVDDAAGGVGVAELDVEYQQAIVDFGLMVRVAEWEPIGRIHNSARPTSIDLYAGGRYSQVSLEFDPQIAPKLSQTRDWIDPIVGGKLVVPLAQRLHLAANGDVGGFGLQSDFTWSSTALLGVDFSLFNNVATASVGYRAVGWDYSSGSGSQKFTWDVISHGPLLGFSMQF